MIQIKDKIYRNLEEQVLKNKSDIEDITSVSNLLGIKVVGQVENAALLPAEDSEEFAELEYGDTYAVGNPLAEDVTYDYYVKTRPNDSFDYPHWFNIGNLRGEQGIKGDPGDGFIFIGNESVTINNTNTASDTAEHSALFGTDNTVRANNALVSGVENTVTGNGATAIGGFNTASGLYAFAQGNQNTASGQYTSATGNLCVASAQSAHAEGARTKATGQNAHTEGYLSRATNGVTASHAEGRNTLASGAAAHAEGYSDGSGEDDSQYIQATGQGAHAEGYATQNYKNIASGRGSHVEGYGCQASANYSRAAGTQTRAKEANQTAIGKWNADNGNALLIVGNGTSDSNRKNAMAVISDGSILVGRNTTDVDNPFTLATKGYVDSHSGGGSEWETVWNNTDINFEDHTVFVNGEIVIQPELPEDATLCKVTFLDSYENEFDVIMPRPKATANKDGVSTVTVYPQDIDQYQANASGDETYVVPFQFTFREKPNGQYYIYLKGQPYNYGVMMFSSFQEASYDYDFDGAWYLVKTCPIPLRIAVR